MILPNKSLNSKLLFGISIWRSSKIIDEGNKIYVYKISEKNIANKIEIMTGIRDNGYVEVISGLNEGDNIVAEGLKKVRPRGKIKPIKK